MIISPEHSDLKLSKHHPHPKSRTPRSDREARRRKTRWPVYFHGAWHGIYGNATLEEIRIINGVISIPGKILTRERFSKLLRIYKAANSMPVLLRISQDDSIFVDDLDVSVENGITPHFIYRVEDGVRLNGSHSFLPSKLEDNWQTLFGDLSLGEVDILITEMNEPGSVWPHERIISKIKEIKSLSESIVA